MSTLTTSLRLPRDLFTDLSDAVTDQDKLFIIKVARELGLPIDESLKRCLGTGGVISLIPTMDVDSDDNSQCPIWFSNIGNMYRKCTRPRLNPDSLCIIHNMSSIGCSTSVSGFKKRYPVKYNDQIFWAIEDNSCHALYEDGQVYMDGRFIRIGISPDYRWTHKSTLPSKSTSTSN